MLRDLLSARNTTRLARGAHALRWLGQLGALGIFVIALIDFSIIPLPLPNLTDLMLLWLVSHGESPWALIPAAVAGAIAGAYTTWHVGYRGGRKVLLRYRSFLPVDPVLRWMERHPVYSALAFPLFPPPIPLTLFVLACGAIGISRLRFFTAFSAALCLRYMVIAWIAETFGRHIVRQWVWVLRKGSGPLLWAVGAIVAGGIIWHIVRTFSRRKSTLPEEQPAEMI